MPRPHIKLYSTPILDKRGEGVPKSGVAWFCIRNQNQRMGSPQ